MKEARPKRLAPIRCHLFDILGKAKVGREIRSINLTDILFIFWLSQFPSKTVPVYCEMSFSQATSSSTLLTHIHARSRQSVSLWILGSDGEMKMPYCIESKTQVFFFTFWIEIRAHLDIPHWYWGVLYSSDTKWMASYNYDWPCFLPSELYFK